MPQSEALQKIISNMETVIVVPRTPLLRFVFEEALLCINGLVAFWRNKAIRLLNQCFRAGE